MTFRFVAVLMVASSCARATAPSTGTSGPPPDAAPASAAMTALVALLSSGAPIPESSASSAPIEAGALGTPEGGPAASPALEGIDFIDEARTLFRVAACGPGGDFPARFDADAVARHCDALGRAYREYQKTWIDMAKPTIAALRPKDLPGAVVYPFGGGDLTSALATFPDATEITTVSLEPAGDIRPVDRLSGDRVTQELPAHRLHLERLFEKAHSRTDNLEKESKTELPGEILFALAALVVHGDEPVSLRYFRLRPDGSIAYVSQEDIDAARPGAERRAVFANAELRFRRAGNPEAPVQVLRHISFNLDDAHLKSDPSLLTHLSAKGKVAAMTKAATHLLWNDHFSMMRGWLLAHTDWMISDSTGIPPRFAEPAGFVQDTYGTFNGPAQFGAPDARDGADLKKVFASQPARPLPFRYGYPDKDGHGHMIVMRRVGDGGGA